MSKRLESMKITQVTIINDKMVNLHQSPQRNDTSPVNQIQTIQNVSQTPTNC